MNWTIFCLVAVFLSGIPGLAQLAGNEPLALRRAVANQSLVPRFSKFELVLELQAAYENPFDPGQIDVYAIFTSPGSKTVRVNGFLDQPFSRKLDGQTEKVEAAGAPVWKVRFAPDQVGGWKYQVFAKDRTGSVSLPEAGFTVASSAAPGFIRRSVKNPRGFSWDNGQAFFAIGENVCWGGGRGSYDFEEWLPALSRAGGNWIRIWMSSWNCALEWSREGRGDWRNGEYLGVGIYSLGNAWKLDTILDLADQNGLTMMLCFGTYGEFNIGGFFNEGQWKSNPYNVANGGPCAKPEDFWTSPEARRLYQRRLRYLTARYAWRTGIHSWEFWNEAKAPASWVGEMARYLKGTGEFQGQASDPQGHLVTTTYGNPEVWRIPEIDITQSHSYGKADFPDHSPKILEDIRQHWDVRKPHLVAEFGIDWRSPDGKYDPEHRGVNLHNGLWSSALSGNAGGAMIWWWDNYVHPSNLYSHFRPLRNFADTVAWSEGEWQPLEADAPKVRFCGLKLERAAVFWVQNPEHHWKNVLDKTPVIPIESHEIALRSFPVGRYAIEWWDTWEGKIFNRESVESKADTLVVRLPALATDLAARIAPQP